MNSGLSRLLLALMLSAPLIGCGGDDVSSYTAPSDADPGTGPVRVLAAIVPVGEDTWFVKLTGRNDIVELVEPGFRQILDSLDFPQKAGEPSMTWTTPKGWKEDRTKPNRVATLTLENMPQPEMTITKLGEGAAMVKPNVDRWRRLDLGLFAITPRALEKVITQKDIKGHKVTIVDMRGPGGKSPMSPPRGHPDVPKGNRPQPQGKAPLKYKAPEGWKESGNPSGLTVVSMTVTEGGATAQLKVTPLNGSMPGGLTGNVTRWRQEVALPPIEAAEVEKMRFPTIQVGGVEAKMIDLEGKDKRSLVVWFERAGTTWFFKFIGPSKVVGSQKAKFEEFMKSVQFPGGAE